MRFDLFMFWLLSAVWNFHQERLQEGKIEFVEKTFNLETVTIKTVTEPKISSY